MSTSTTTLRAGGDGSRAKLGSVASRWPLVMGTLSVALSAFLAIWTGTTSTPAPLFGSFSFPVAATSTVALSVSGYVLTPLITMAAMSWDTIAQRRGPQVDRNFALRPMYGTALRWLTAFGFVIAIWHVLNIANAIAGA